MIHNKEYYFNQLTQYKVDFTEEKLLDFLVDTSAHLCESLKIPQAARSYRIEEEERLLAKMLFTSKQLYEANPYEYRGFNLDKIIDGIDTEYLARRIRRGDDNPFKSVKRRTQ